MFLSGVFQPGDRVALLHRETQDTGLVDWGGRTRFTVLRRSGAHVMWGKTSETSPAALYSSCGGGWGLLRSGLCQHEKGVYLLGVMIGGRELLAVSCPCDVIRLLEPETGDVSTAFSDTRYRPGRMCPGETGQMYVVHAVKPTPVLQLSCSTTNFSLMRTIQTGMERYYSICYIPIHRLIVISDHSPGIIRAMSCESEEVVWEVKGQVEGVECHPHGMVHSPALDALFVADGNNTRILVLNPGDGSLRQELPLDQKMGGIGNLYLSYDQLIVHHHAEGKVKVSVFRLE